MDHANISKNCNLELNFCNCLQILVISSGMLFIFWIFVLNIVAHVNYVPIKCNLDIYSKKKIRPLSPEIMLRILFLIFVGLLLCQCNIDEILPVFILLYPKFLDFLLYISKSNIKLLSKISCFTMLIHIFSISFTPAASIFACL